MTIAPPSTARPKAYRYGAAMLLVTAATILGALGFEHIGGYIPCELCVQQRYMYYAAIPLLFIALVLVSAEKPKVAGLLFLLVAFGFLANAGLGVYQAGAEWKFWPGPTTCGTQQGIAANTGDLLQSLENPNVIRCDEASFRFAGLSFAGWNVVVSLLIFLFALKAAFATSIPRR